MIPVYDLITGGDKCIYRDVPVYDSASMANGELIMLGTTDPDSNADQGVAFITAYTGANTEAIDALGIVCESYSTAATIDNKPAEGSLYLKAIVNPFMIYRAEYSQGTTVTVTTGGSSTTVTVSSLEDDIDAGWLYFVGASGGSAINKLRFLTAAASGSCTVDSAITTTTSDTFIKILPVNHRLTALTTDGINLKSQAAAGAGVSLHIIENYMVADGHSLSSLRGIVGYNGLLNAKFYANIAMLDHVYNPYKN